jgi:DNA modification methylase
MSVRVGFRGMAGNVLYYGDNLAALRESIKDESIDLVYLDPPFNSQANYNVLFKAPTGEQSHAQIEAFEDTWHWGESAEQAFDEVVKSSNTDAAELLRAMRSFLGENDMMAYLAMMVVRLLELHRVLKESGTLYLHCDPTASHYLKALLDAVFGPERFINEIIWQRTSAHNDPVRYGRVHDTIFFYGKTAQRTWNQGFEAPDENYFSAHDFEKDKEGRFYRKRDLTAPGHGTVSGQYEWRGKHPPKGRMWSYTEDNMERLEAEGRIAYTSTGMPRLKIYEADLKGVPYQDVWANPDLWLNAAAAERLGYPTQKPLALMERIVNTSSNEGDVVLDPFCGCGTTIHAAQKLNRRWIGIDITHLAISLIEKRLNDAFPGIKYEVQGTPKDTEGARDLAARDKYQFQWWAVSLVNAVPFGGKKKGADTGIDGLIYFYDFDPKGKVLTEKIIVSVKGGDNVGVGMIRDLAHVVAREKARMGLFITLAEPTDPMRKEALKEGYCETSSGGKFLKLQIATIEQLLAGKRADLPSSDPTQFAKAAQEAPKALALAEAPPLPETERKYPTKK